MRPCKVTSMLLIFQFHKGTIKTIVVLLSLIMLIYFNSIKVRLKRFDESKNFRVISISIP